MLQKGALENGFFKKKLFLGLLKTLGFFKRVTWHGTDEQEAADIRKNIDLNAHVTVIPDIPIIPGEVQYPVVKLQGSIKLIYLSLITEKKNLKFLLELLSSPGLTGVRLDIIAKEPW